MISGQRRHQNMNMVGHHHELVKAIGCAIVVLQHIFHDLPQFRPGQQTFAVTLVQPLLPTIGKTPVVFLLGFGVPRFRMRF